MLFRSDLTWDASKLGYISSRAGDQLTTSSKQLSATALGSTGVRLVGAGLNQNPIADGTVAYVTLKLSSSLSGTTPVNCANAQSSDAQGRALTTNCVAGQMKASARCGCDVNGDGVVNVQDVQVIINQVLGLVAAICDLNGDGIVNIGDIQVVINAILGQSCPI